MVDEQRHPIMDQSHFVGGMGGDDAGSPHQGPIRGLPGFPQSPESQELTVGSGEV